MSILITRSGQVPDARMFVQVTDVTRVSIGLEDLGEPLGCLLGEERT